MRIFSYYFLYISATSIVKFHKMTQIDLSFFLVSNKLVSRHGCRLLNPAISVFTSIISHKNMTCIH